MADQNQNGIPDSWDRPLGILLTLAGLVFAGLAYRLDPCPWWVAFAAGLTTAVGGAFKIGIVPPRWPSSLSFYPVLAVGLAALVTAPGCIDPAWQAGATMRSAGNMADKAIAAASDDDLAACKSKHGSKTPGIRKCYAESGGAQALKVWRGGVLQGINTAMISYVTTLTLIEQTRGKKPDLIMALAMLKPIACAIERTVRQWRDKLGAVAVLILGITRPATGGKCK